MNANSEYNDLLASIKRMEARVERLTRIRQLLEQEIDEILASAHIDITALRLQLETLAYEGADQADPPKN